MHLKTVDKLYAVEVVKKEGERVKIHYVGYDDRLDEWISVASQSASA